MATNEGRRAYSSNVYGGDPYDDEISLYDLVAILWRNKIVGIAAAAAVMAAVLGYLVIAKPVYKVDVHFLPPLWQDIEALNIAKQYGLLGYDTDEVYQEFILQLNSLALRREFFNGNNVLSYYSTEETSNANSAFAAFNESLTVSSPDRGEDTPFRVISFEMGDAEQAAFLLNQFVGFAFDSTKEKLIGSVYADVTAEIARLDRLIESKREVAEQRRQDMTAKLEEALLIARKLNIQKLSDYSRAYEANSQLTASVMNTVELPLYTRGVTALEAEIEALKNRKSDDPYIEGLRDAQERLKTLRALVIDSQAIKVANIDSTAVVPLRPEKPKKLLILAVGMCLALLLGAMAAFFAEFVKGLRRQLKSAADNEGR